MCNGEIKKSVASPNEDRLRTLMEGNLQGAKVRNNSGPQLNSGFSMVLVFVGSLAQIVWIISSILS